MISDQCLSGGDFNSGQSVFFRLPSLYEEDVLDVHISRSAVF